MKTCKRLAIAILSVAASSCTVKIPKNLPEPATCTYKGYTLEEFTNVKDYDHLKFKDRDIIFVRLTDVTDADLSDWYSNMKNAFHNKSIATYLELAENDSLTTISDYAFSDFDCLVSITLPQSVKTVGNYAFQNCKSLRWAIIKNQKDSVSVQDDVFRGCHPDLKILWE